MTLTSIPRTFHVTMSIAAIIKHARAPRRLDGMFIDRVTGNPLPGEELLRQTHALAEKGFEVIPPCDHHDAKGNCLGHDTTDEAAA